MLLTLPGTPLLCPRVRQPQAEVESQQRKTSFDRILVECCLQRLNELLIELFRVEVMRTQPTLPALPLVIAWGLMAQSKPFFSILHKQLYTLTSDSEVEVGL